MMLNHHKKWFSHNNWVENIDIVCRQLSSPLSISRYTTQIRHFTSSWQIISKTALLPTFCVVVHSLNKLMLVDVPTYMQDDGQGICIAAGIAFASVNAVDDKHVVVWNETDTKTSGDYTNGRRDSCRIFIIASTL